jgi:tRNA (mo5U34)-methyltransferase
MHPVFRFEKELLMNTRLKLTTPEIKKRIRELGEWFQNLDIGGVQTAPNHFLGDYPNIKWNRFAHSIPMDLRGKSVLDIGCNAGFYSIEMKRRGADRVLGIDVDDDYLDQARFAAEMFDYDIEFQKRSVYELQELEERFDVVLFLGVFYHLRHPLLALDFISEYAANDLMVFQSMVRGSRKIEAFNKDYDFWEEEIFENPVFPRMYFIENEYANDPTNWWIPNRSCVEAMLRSSGFDIVDHPEEEVFICRKR